MGVDEYVRASGTEILWADLTEEDVLVGQLDGDHLSRLGRCRQGAGLHADLHVAPDAAGMIMLRIPDEVAPTPEQFACMGDVDEVWEPVLDNEAGLLGGRGLLHYHTLMLPGHQIFLEIRVEEKAFGCCA